MTIPGNELIRLENISLRNGLSYILRDIHLILKQGESLAVTGNSGSGKTSLAKILAGLDYPSGGILSVRPGLKRVMVHQQDQFMSLSGRRSTYYGQRYENQGMENTPTVLDYLSKVQEKTDPFSTDNSLTSIMQKMQIDHLSQNKLLQLSNGERKRTQLAAALLQEPDLLILDQPFVGLDTASRLNLADLMEKLMKVGISFVIICDPKHIPSGVHQVLELSGGMVNQYTSREKYIPSDHKHEKEDEETDDRLFHILPEPEVKFNDIVRMNRVNVTIGNKEILKNISWQVKSGEQWALLGPNGAGKTTLLSLITADNPQGYTNDLVLFDRKRGSGESIWDIKKKIGFVSPELHLYFLRGAGIYNTIPGLKAKTTAKYDSLKCLDVLLSGFRDEIGFASIPTDLQREIAETWLSILKLDHLKEHLYVKASFGQQRSLLLGRAMVKSPFLLILDEPCQGLDHNQAHYFIRLLNMICVRLNTTLIYVTHLKEEIPPCVNKMIILDEGRVEYCGEYRSIND
ncbi:MAG: ATP-binding cassette domain-containing protein [Mangrovibacterium sp.]